MAKDMPHTRVLVVEDEAAIRDMLAFNLGRAGYEVLPAGSGREARASIADRYPDVVLMDWMLPDVSGLELTRQLKRDPETREIPVIMLTARGEVMDRVVGLELGADDYLPKPFEPRELVARIQNIFKRSQALPSATRFRFGEFELDLDKKTLCRKDTELPITATEFALLC